VAARALEEEGLPRPSFHAAAVDAVAHATLDHAEDVPSVEGDNTSSDVDAEAGNMRERASAWEDRSRRDSSEACEEEAGHEVLPFHHKEEACLVRRCMALEEEAWIHVVEA